MKLLLIKVLVLLLCIPVYPFYVVLITFERKSYLGNQATFKKVSREYWGEVWDVLTYRRTNK